MTYCWSSLSVTQLALVIWSVKFEGAVLQYIRFNKTANPIWIIYNSGQKRLTQFKCYLCTYLGWWVVKIIYTARISGKCLGSTNTTYYILRLPNFPSSTVAHVVSRLVKKKINSNNLMSIYLFESVQVFSDVRNPVRLK